MHRIAKTFARLKAEGRKALIGYLTAGFPHKDSLQRLVPLLEKAGLDLIEIGIPFSDPIADGPTIQRASQAALANGVTLDWIFGHVREIRRHVHRPIIFMSYSNPIHLLGVERFFQRAKSAGVDGLIVPDLIPEEAGWLRSAAKFGIDLIHLVAPTTPDARLRDVARATRGFLYAVSVTGVTGVRAKLPSELPRFLKKIKAQSRYPVAVGFGLSTPAQVRAASRYADGVIVGSQLIKEIEQSQYKGFKGASQYVRSLRRVLNSKEVSNHAA